MCNIILAKILSAHFSCSSRFGSTVGQFVLTASLRSQVNPDNKDEFRDVSPERRVPWLDFSKIRLIHAYMQSVRGLCSRFDSAPFLCIQLSGVKCALNSASHNYTKRPIYD